MKKMKIKAILFDMDGVLVDSEPLQFEAHRKALEKFGIAISKEEYIMYGASSSSKNFYAKMSEMKGVVIDIAEVQKYKRALYRKSIAEIVPREGIVELLESLKEHFIFGVVTGSSRENAILTLEQVALMKYFKSVVTSDDVENNKPMPDGYLFGAKSINIEPAECMAIEDSRSGVLAAKAAGMVCIAAPNEFTKIQDFSQADIEIANISEFSLDLIENLS